MREKSGVQAQFLLGPAGSGKTFRCLEEIRDALRENAEGPPLILLAPKQATFQLERQLLDSERWGERPREPEETPTVGSPGVSPHQICGYTRLNIFSFERLARFVLEESIIAPPRQLTDEGRVMVLRALLLRHERELKLFRGSARRPGFAQELGLLFNEFQQHQLTPLKLHAFAQRPGLRPELRGKLEDLALLNDAYINWLAERELQDEDCLLDAATEALRVAASRQSAAISMNKSGGLPTAATIQNLWLDGFAEMTPQELDLLAAVLPFCKRATLTFCLDPSAAQKGGNSWLSLWSAVGKTHQQCRQRMENLPGCKISVETLKRHPQKNRFAKNVALAWLEENWSQPPRADSEKSAIRNPGFAKGYAEASPQSAIRNPFDRLGADEFVAGKSGACISTRIPAAARLAADFGSRACEPDRRSDSARARRSAGRRG